MPYNVLIATRSHSRGFPASNLLLGSSIGPGSLGQPGSHLAWRDLYQCNAPPTADTIHFCISTRRCYMPVLHPLLDLLCIFSSLRKTRVAALLAQTVTMTTLNRTGRRHGSHHQPRRTSFSRAILFHLSSPAHPPLSREQLHAARNYQHPSAVCLSVCLSVCLAVSLSAQRPWSLFVPFSAAVLVPAPCTALACPA